MHWVIGTAVEDASRWLGKISQRLVALLFFLSLNLQAILIYLSEKPGVNNWSLCERFEIQQAWAFCQFLIEANYSSEFWVKELASLMIKSKIERMH